MRRPRSAHAVAALLSACHAVACACLLTLLQIQTATLPLRAGIDYHDGAQHGRVQPNFELWHLLRPWALYTPQASPADQEQALLDVIRALPPTHLRGIGAWADFQFEGRNPERRRLFERLRRHDVRGAWLRYPPRRMSRVALWAAKGQLMFDLSPRGHGVDCYRTWESLALGMIVIVQRGPLDSVYDGLPVVIVDDYAQITVERLRQWAREHRAKAAAGAYPTVEVAPGIRLPERVTTEYWLRTMRAAARAAAQLI